MSDRDAPARDESRTCSFCGDVVMFCSCMLDDPVIVDPEPDVPSEDHTS